MSTPKVEVRRAVYLLSAIRLLLIIVAVVVAQGLDICIKSRDRNSCCATIGKRDLITTMIFPP